MAAWLYLIFYKQHGHLMKWKLLYFFAGECYWQMSSIQLKNQHLNLCLSDYVADIKLHTIIIKCHLETTYNNSAVEAEVDGEKLHPKMCHLKCSNIKFKFLSFYTCTYGFFQFIFVSWSCPVKI